METNSNEARLTAIRNKGVSPAKHKTLFAVNDSHRKDSANSLADLSDETLALALVAPKSAPDVARTIGNVGRSTAGDVLAAIFRTLSLTVKDADKNGARKVLPPSDWVNLPDAPAFRLLNRMKDADRDAATAIAKGNENHVATLRALDQQGYFKPVSKAKAALREAFPDGIPSDAVESVTLENPFAPVNETATETA